MSVKEIKKLKLVIEHALEKGESTSGEAGFVFNLHLRP